MIGKLKLNKVEYANSEEFAFEEIDTVASLFKGTTLRFTKKNLANEAKKLCLIARSKKNPEDEWTLPCSDPLSKTMRNALKNGTSKEDAIAIISKLKVWADEDGKYFVFSPSSSPEEEFDLDKLSKTKPSYETLLNSGY